MIATESTVAHVGVRLIELTSRQHETTFHALITLADMLERLEQRLAAIEARITANGAKQ